LQGNHCVKLTLDIPFMFQDKGMQLFSLILQRKKGVEIHEEGENLHWCAKDSAETQNLNSKTVIGE
jgi:hypothetical protein